MLFPFRHTHFLRLSTGQAYSFICVYFCASAAIGHGCNAFRHVVGCLFGGKICGFVIVSKKKNFISSNLLNKFMLAHSFAFLTWFFYMLHEDFLERKTMLVLCSVCRLSLVGRVDQNLLHSAEVNVFKYLMLLERWFFYRSCSFLFTEWLSNPCIDLSCAQCFA